MCTVCVCNVTYIMGCGHCERMWFGCIMKAGVAEQDQCSVMNHSCCTVLVNKESRVGAGTVEWLFTLSLYSVQYFSHSPLSYLHFLWLIAEWLRAAKLSLPMVPDFSHMTEWHTWCSAFFSLLCLSFSLGLHHALPAFLFHALLWFLWFSARWLSSVCLWG